MVVVEAKGGHSDNDSVDSACMVRVCMCGARMLCEQRGKQARKHACRQAPNPTPTPPPSSPFPFPLHEPAVASNKAVLAEDRHVHALTQHALAHDGQVGLAGCAVPKSAATRLQVHVHAGNVVK